MKLLPFTTNYLQQIVDTPCSQMSTFLDDGKVESEFVQQVNNIKLQFRGYSNSRRSRTMSIAMSHEKIFNANGAYRIVVDNNIMAHQEAVTALKIQFGEWISQTERTNTAKKIRILDLACGGEPLTICEIARHFSRITFEYVGIDINADQVNAAKNFKSYPENMRFNQILLGNAWDLSSCDLDGKFDIVFSGLNFHHAVPTEIYSLAKSLQGILEIDGMMFNHDLYMPEGYAYTARPADTLEKSYSLNKNINLNQDQFELLQSQQNGLKVQWREEFLKDYRNLLNKLHINSNDQDRILEHVSDRDYPISMNQMAAIFNASGFSSSGQYFSDKHPLGRYLGIFSARVSKDTK